MEYNTATVNSAGNATIITLRMILPKKNGVWKNSNSWFSFMPNMGINGLIFQNCYRGGIIFLMEVLKLHKKYCSNIFKCSKFILLTWKNKLRFNSLRVIHHFRNQLKPVTEPSCFLVCLPRRWTLYRVISIEE